MAVAEDHWPGPDQQIDVFAPAFSPDARTGALADENPRVKVSEASGRQDFPGSCDPLVAAVNFLRRTAEPQSS